MKSATAVLQMLVRISGLGLIVLGVLFWTGNALNLLPVHMLLGLALVIMLWVLAAMAARAGVPLGFVGLAVAWGLIVVVLGMTQTRILPGDAHWVIRIVHLLVGLGALGLAEGLAGRIKRTQTPVLRQSEAAPASINTR